MLSKSWSWVTSNSFNVSLVKKLLTVKISTYFPILYEESDNFRQEERYEVDEFKEYNFSRKTTSTRLLPCQEAYDFAREVT